MYEALYRTTNSINKSIHNSSVFAISPFETSPPSVSQLLFDLLVFLLVLFKDKCILYLNVAIARYHIVSKRTYDDQLRHLKFDQQIHSQFFCICYIFFWYQWTINFMPPTLQARSSRNRSSTFKAVVKTVAPKTRCAQKRKINGIQPTSKRKNVDDPRPNNTKIKTGRVKLANLI